MSLVLQSSGGGQITIQEPATASNFTQTLPAASGEVMVSGNQPAFSASMFNGNASQSVTSATFTKIRIDTLDATFPNTGYDPTTNFRFTPAVAGYYQINGSVTVAGTSISGAIVSIYKNGAEYKRGTQIFTTATNNLDPTVASLVYLNGSTDYVELYGYVAASAAPAFGIGVTQTYFNGCMVRGA